MLGVSESDYVAICETLRWRLGSRSSISSIFFFGVRRKEEKKERRVAFALGLLYLAVMKKKKRKPLAVLVIVLMPSARAVTVMLMGPKPRSGVKATVAVWPAAMLAMVPWVRLPVSRRGACRVMVQ